MGICKLCSIARAKESQERNAKHRKAYLADYRAKNHARIYERRLSYAFGITLDEYNSMLEAQGGTCAICKGPPRGKSWRRLVVDHCHVTGQLRGLLCDTCNRTLGLLHDNLQVAQAAASYLQLHQSSTSPT